MTAETHPIHCDVTNPWKEKKERKKKRKEPDGLQYVVTEVGQGYLRRKG